MPVRPQGGASDLTAPYREPSSPSPEPLARPAALGAVRSVHGAVRARTDLVFILVVAVGIVATLAALAQRAWIEAAVVAVVVAAFATHQVLRLRGVSVALHQAGVAVRRGRSVATVAFADVDEVWLGAIDRTSAIVRIRRLELVTHDGRRVKVPLEVVEADELVARILRQTSEAVAAQAEAALDAGETVTFGRVSLSADGIAFGRDARVPWASVRLVRFQPGRVHFFRGTTLVPWRRVDWESVPHPVLFVRLVRRLAPREEHDDSVRL